jgi:hypothetical protein
LKTWATTAALALVGVAVLAGSANGDPSPAARSAQKGEPRIDQMVVFGGGAVVKGRVRTKRTTVAIGKRRCGVAAATPLAALLRADPGPIGFHDYGSCTRRPADSAGLFVKAMRGERNRAQDGWVYKVGRAGAQPQKLATAGAADPAGPFGSGRLREGDRVVWFYCRQLSTGTCQRSLEVETDVEGSQLAVTVTGYDDAGDGTTIGGATIRVGGKRATTGADGKATLTLDRGRHFVYAAKQGTIRSFAERVTIE